MTCLQLDTMLMLKKYLPLLTPSEFHCFLVGAHSTIAGFAFGLFVLFGVSPSYLFERFGVSLSKCTYKCVYDEKIFWLMWLAVGCV